MLTQDPAGAALRGLTERIRGTNAGALDAASVRVLMRAALQHGSADLAKAALSAAAKEALASAPAIERLLAACSAKDRAAIERELQRARVENYLSSKSALVAAQFLADAGAADLIRAALAFTDLSNAQHADLARLRRLTPKSEKPDPKRDVRVFVSGLVTLDPIGPAIEVGLLRCGFEPSVQIGSFGMMHHQLRDPMGEAAAFKPDFLILGYDLATLVPDLAAARRNPAQAREIIAAAGESIGDALQAWRQISNAPVLLHTVSGAALRRVGFLDATREDGAESLAAAVNRMLADACKAASGVHLLDVASAFAEMGARAAIDDRRRLFGRFPCSADAFTTWGVLVADCIAVAKRGPKKVVVSDLDNTMWGGIVGDAGPQGVEVGSAYPGNAFLEYQRWLLDLRSQGILIALCSKNDESVALSVFEQHGGMALKLDEVAAHRISWNPKPEAISELASELNLGLDSFVFLDDSIHERAAVREVLPQVLVPDLPDDPVQRVAFLRNLRELWPLQLTSTDLKRADEYQAQRRRDELKTKSGSLSDFLMSLEQVLTITPARDSDWTRIAQMHQRTNQFNMTTRRFDEATLKKMHTAGARIYTGALRDRFGDQGIIIAAIALPEGDAWRLETFLMSCRVFGRQVEQAFTGFIAAQARAAGAKAIRGEYLPTERNKPYADTFARLGFAGPQPHAAGDGAEWWSLDLAGAKIEHAAVRIEVAN